MRRRIWSRNVCTNCLTRIFLRRPVTRDLFYSPMIWTSPTLSQRLVNGYRASFFFDSAACDLITSITIWSWSSWGMVGCLQKELSSASRRGEFGRARCPSKGRVVCPGKPPTEDFWVARASSESRSLGLCRWMAFLRGITEPRVALVFVAGRCAAATCLRGTMRLLCREGRRPAGPRPTGPKPKESARHLR